MPASAAVLTASNPLSDEEIVSRVLDGDTPLFEVLMRRHNERVYRAARAILRDDREAEDTMQEAYVNAYAHLAQFDGRARLHNRTRNGRRSAASRDDSSNRRSTISPMDIA